MQGRKLDSHLRSKVEELLRDPDISLKDISVRMDCSSCLIANINRDAGYIRAQNPNRKRATKSRYAGRGRG